MGPKDIELDKKQQKLSNLSSKYMMLFGIATSSTILSQILSFCVEFTLRRNFWILDYTVNLLCIYLQFSFAKDDYRKCCGFCDGKCRDYVSDRNREKILSHSVATSVSPRDGDGTPKS